MQEHETEIHKLGNLWKRVPNDRQSNQHQIGIHKWSMIHITTCTCKYLQQMWQTWAVLRTALNPAICSSCNKDMCLMFLRKCSYDCILWVCSTCIRISLKRKFTMIRVFKDMANCALITITQGYVSTRQIKLVQSKSGCRIYMAVVWLSNEIS